MWLVTKYGFYSVVAHRNEPDVMLVRGRVVDDLEVLRGFGEGRGIPMPEIVESGGSDYCCRMFMPRCDWERLGAALAAEIDYDNFKDQVHGQRDRDAAYMQMWSTMRRFQERLQPELVQIIPEWDYLEQMAEETAEGYWEWAAQAEDDDDDEPTEDDIFLFLDSLRDSGITNMFGAGPYIEDTFGMKAAEAQEWLGRWMRTYAQRHGLEGE